MFVNMHFTKGSLLWVKSSVLNPCLGNRKLAKIRLKKTCHFSTVDCTNNAPQTKALMFLLSMSLQSMRYWGETGFHHWLPTASLKNYISFVTNFRISPHQCCHVYC